jgi:hypothetical protein
VIVGETVIVHRYQTDRYGDRVEVSTHQIPRCAFAPRSQGGLRGTSEETDRSDTVVSVAVLHAPAGADLNAQDVIELSNGSAWEVGGLPEHWHSPFPGAWSPGVVVPLRRMTG